MRAGLDWFGISEHSPLPAGFSCGLYAGNLDCEFPRLARQVMAMRSHGERPRLLLGMELDWIPSRRAYMESLCAAWPFDYVLGSLHYLDGISVGSAASWPRDMGRDAREERFFAYYREMAAMAASGLVNIASHPDFVKLRCHEDFGRWLERPESLSAVGDALSALDGNGAAMELSSAGIRQPFAEPYPAPAIMRLARKLGLMISFASDAHECADIARGFDELAAYARSFGFEKSVVFVRRRPLELRF